MAVEDLAQVTATLTNLLETRMRASRAWPVSQTAEVSPLPPDLIAGGVGVGLYLYHVTEDAHFKSDPGTAFGGGSKPDKPLALNLYYLLTVSHANLDNIDDPLRAQTILSVAMRVLHDYAIITDDSVMVDFNGVESAVFAEALRGRQNRLRVTLRPVPPDDAVDYWTAGTAPQRLSAYYQVSVVLVEPTEPVASSAGPVLTYGSGVLPTSAPHLVRTDSLRRIVVAEEPTARQVPVQPAQPTLGGDFELQGSLLTGEGTALRFRGDYGTFDVDAGLWGVVASAEKVFARVSDTMGAIPTMPGTWMVSVLVRRSFRVGESVRTIVHASNEMPVQITPRITETSGTGPTLGDRSRGTPFVLEGWRFQGSESLGFPVEVPYEISDEELDPRVVRLLVGGQALRKVDSGPLTEPGTFTVVDDTQLEVRLPDSLDLGSVQPVQVWVNGVASAPVWLRVIA